MATNAVNRYFEGLLVGGVLGFVAGLLTAPKPGTELRQDLAQTADDLLSVMSDQFYDVKDSVQDKVQPLSERAGQYKRKVASTAAGVKGKIVQKTDNLKHNVSAKAQDLAADARGLVDNYMGNNSGPVYTAGNRVSPTSAAHSAADSCSTYAANNPEATSS